MPEFQSPTDIGNRALQHCGADLMDATLGFSEQSQRARAINFNYGKLRRAELGRNLWGFATRKAAIRPVDTNTMMLSPTLWSSAVTYFVGSIVSDGNNTLWQSVLRNNTGSSNQPGQNFTAWVPYFGPLTAEPFDSSHAYLAGELVYTLSGAGTFNIYKSQTDGNAVHPAMPNSWSANTIYQTDDVVEVWPAWSSATTYTAGQTVTYTDGNTYSSLTGSNHNNIPSATVGTSWALMPTLTLMSALMPSNLFPAPSMTLSTPIDEWQIETAYSIGTFAMFIGNQYVSIANSNTGNYPNASGSTSWAQVTGGTSYQSLIDGNQGNNPANAPALWASGTSYSIGNQVGASDGLIYTSKTNSNLGNNPANGGSPSNWTNTGVFNPWTTVFTLGGGNSQWIQIGGSAFPNGVTVTPLKITWPIGTGPMSQSWSRNCYRLPGGYLRKAPQLPSAGRSSWLGAPGNLSATDWEYDGDFLVTIDSNVIVLRFVADVQDVTKFPDLFCEGLACRIALEIVPPITQSVNKEAAIKASYEKFMTEARTVGGIEAGPVEPPLDDLIACRI